ncbi:hypothetical protein PMAYCL1PPCAC_32772, partial [Pristionchus mayeri]
MLKSKPMYACLCCQFAYNFSATLLQAFLPTYFRDELFITLSMNGIYTMIPFAVQIFMKTFCSFIADTLRRKGILEPTMSAKLFQTICSVGVAISLISLAFLPSCDRPWIVAICLLSYGIFYSFGIPGYYTSLMSIAPQYSGTLSSMVMLAATVANIVSPSLASLLMTLKTPHVWKMVFTFTGVVNLIGGGIFLIYGDAEVQEWVILGKKREEADVAEDEKRREEEKSEPIQIEFSSGSAKSL